MSSYIILNPERYAIVTSNRKKGALVGSGKILGLVTDEAYSLG